jgi:anaerobic selenocysteine-containing dehydrogenase
LWINKKIAVKLGLKDGETVRIWSDATGAEGRVRIKACEGIHPAAVFAFVGFGHTSKGMTVEKGKAGINVNEFIPDHMEWVSGAAPTQEALVKIERMR